MVEDGIYRFLPAVRGHDNTVEPAGSLQRLEEALRGMHRDHAADQVAECRRALERDRRRLRPQR